MGPPASSTGLGGGGDQRGETSSSAIAMAGLGGGGQRPLPTSVARLRATAPRRSSLPRCDRAAPSSSPSIGGGLERQRGIKVT